MPSGFRTALFQLSFDYIDGGGKSQPVRFDKPLSLWKVCPRLGGFGLSGVTVTLLQVIWSALRSRMKVPLALAEEMLIRFKVRRRIGNSGRPIIRLPLEVTLRTVCGLVATT
jgi:hypothetical protein